MNVPPLNITKETQGGWKIYLFRHFWDDVFWKDPPDMNLVNPTRVEVTSDIRPWFYVFFVAGIGLAFQGTLPSGNPKILRAIQVFASSNLLSWSLANCSNLAHSRYSNKCPCATLSFCCRVHANGNFPDLTTQRFSALKTATWANWSRCPFWQHFMRRRPVRRPCKSKPCSQLGSQDGRFNGLTFSPLPAFQPFGLLTWSRWFALIFVFCFLDVELGYALQRIFGTSKSVNLVGNTFAGLLLCAAMKAEVYKKKHISDLIPCPMRNLLRGTSFIRVSLSITIKKHHCSKPYKITWI